VGIRVVALIPSLLVVAGCAYQTVDDLSPQPTAPEKAADNGYYQWVVVAEVKGADDAPSPGFCTNPMCNDEFIQVSLNISQILGNAKNPVPTHALYGSEFGDDPFYRGPGSPYLMFIHSAKGVPMIGVWLPVLKTSDGQLAIPGEYLIPWWEKSGCGPYLKELDFTGNPDLRSRWLGQEGAGYWTGEGYGTQELRFGEIRGKRLVYTKGVLLKDMAAQAAKLYIGCGSPSQS